MINLKKKKIPGSIPSVLGESIGAAMVSPWIIMSLQTEGMIRITEHTVDQD